MLRTRAKSNRENCGGCHDTGWRKIYTRVIISPYCRCPLSLYQTTGNDFWLYNKIDWLSFSFVNVQLAHLENRWHEEKKTKQKQKDKEQIETVDEIFKKCENSPTCMIMFCRSAGDPLKAVKPLEVMRVLNIYKQCSYRSIVFSLPLSLSLKAEIETLMLTSIWMMMQVTSDECTAPGMVVLLLFLCCSWW